jgi:hypothetical protein
VARFQIDYRVLDRLEQIGFHLLSKDRAHEFILYRHRFDMNQLLHVQGELEHLYLISHSGMIGKVVKLTEQYWPTEEYKGDTIYSLADNIDKMSLEGQEIHPVTSMITAFYELCREQNLIRAVQPSR